MEYKLYKLTFNTPIHFGSDSVGTSLEEADLICHSDTFFSALCLEYIKLNGAENINKFVDFFNNDNLLISSMLPYKNDDLYIPKPSIIKDSDSPNDRKKMKKLNYIKFSDIDKYLNYIKGEKYFIPDDEYKEYNDFAKYSLNQKVGLREEENRLYSVGTYSFDNNSGLYFILSFSDNEKLEEFETVLKSLSYSGIGGKRTYGLGNFDYKTVDYKTLNYDNFINKLFSDSDSEYKMLISLFSPRENEIDNIDLKNSSYSLIKRNGFIYSESYSKNLQKRKSLCMFKEGSCFTNKINGDIKDVSQQDGKHKVYRYGKAFYIRI